MISKIIARSTRLARPTNILRRGGHGPVSYNEPGGYLFAEKVIKSTKTVMWGCGLFLFVHESAASTSTFTLLDKLELAWR
jgi:hypothetical protein